MQHVLSWISFVFVVFGLFLNYFWWWEFETSVCVDGFVKPGYEYIEQMFKSTFSHNLQNGGASIAVFYKNNLVVNLWGGWADEEAGRLWRNDTLTMVSALCIAMLVDRNLVKYDDLVIKYWPEFGTNGKQNITVKMMACLAKLDTIVTLEQAKDHRELSRIIENQNVNWIVGESVGYHVITHGWLIDQLIRRVDKQQRGLSQFFQEEIQQKFDIDYYIGLPRSLNFRTARLIPLNWKTKLTNFVNNWSILKYYIKMFLFYDRIQWKVWQNPPFLFQNNMAALNNPNIRALDLGSTNGFGTALSLAKILNLFANENLIKNRTLVSMISHPFNIGKNDAILNLPTTTGWGFYFSKSPKNSTLMGHMGYGGQGAKIDLEKNLIFAYLTNAPTTEIGGLSKTWQHFEKSVFDTFY